MILLKLNKVVGMRQFILTLEVITPMFIAGADGKTPDDIVRPPSIKGALRFWWRAAHGFDPLLKQNEGEIFGQAGENTCKSSFYLYVQQGDTRPYVCRDPLPRHSYKIKKYTLNILDYLAYGAFPGRSYIKPGFTFQLNVKIKNGLRAAGVLEAWQYFCRFGALGARSRNGFGSFTVKNAEGDLNDEQKEALMALPGASLLAAYQNHRGFPGFSAFCREARLFKTRQNYDTWDACLAELGHAYRNSRLSLEPPHNYNLRQYLGAPLNKQPQSKLDRHAKPYFLRLHKQKGKYVGFILYLPSRYCMGRQDERPQLDLNKEDQAFTRVCRQMNEALARYLEVIY